jgi:hypothetical protein
MEAPDRATVEASLQGVTEGDRPKLIEIHREGVRQAKQKLGIDDRNRAALVRALEMRSYALELLGAETGE